MKEVLTPIVETVIRLFSKSPKYFKVLQIILSILTTLVVVLTNLKGSIELPSWVDFFTNPQGIFALALGLFVSLLPAKSTDAVKAKVDDTLNK